MFDLGKLGDLSRFAQDAKAIQERQERLQKEQIELLKGIAVKLDEVIAILKKKA